MVRDSKATAAGVKLSLSMHDPRPICRAMAHVLVERGMPARMGGCNSSRGGPCVQILHRMVGGSLRVAPVMNLCMLSHLVAPPPPSLPCAS